MNTGRLPPELCDDGIDLDPRFTQPLIEFLVELLLERFLALAECVLARPRAGVFRAQRLTLALHQPPFVFERSQIRIHLREMFRQLRLSRGEILSRVIDDAAVQAQASRHLKGQAAPRRPILNVVGGLVRVRRKAESRRRDARRGCRVRLERFVVRCGDDHRAARAEVLDDGHAQRAAFERIGAGAKLIQQHQRGQRERAIHRPDIGDVPRKRAEIGGNRLFVADIREHRAENRELGLDRGHPQPRLSHQRGEPGGFQRHRFAARIRPRNQQHRRRRNHEQIDRNGVSTRDAAPRVQTRDDAGNEQRMPRGSQLQPAVCRNRRRDARDEMRESRFCLNDVQLRRGIHRLTQLHRFRAKRVGQDLENPVDLFALQLFQCHEVVVDLDGAERLQIQAGAAARAAVDDSRDRRAMLRFDDQHVAAVAIADHLILQILRGLFSAKVGLQRGSQARPLLAELRPQAGQFGAGRIIDFAGRIDLAADLGDLRFELPAAFGDGLQRGKRAADAPDVGAGKRDGIEKVRECDQSQRLQRPAFDRHRRENRLQIVRRLERETGVAVQVLDAFRRGAQQFADAKRVCLRLQLRQLRRSQRRDREPPDQIDDLVEFKSTQCAWVHVGSRGG